MTAYYNEFDPYAAQWLRNLIQEGHVAPGIVDERSIEDIQPADLTGFTQCHFFAGIGLWSLALRKAGWADDRPVWTMSCPCQPFSTAGEGIGFADERHLWPAAFHLVTKHRPPVVFGEQVTSSAEWINLVRSDMGSLEYAMGLLPIEAASAGAFHLRARIFFVADSDGVGRTQGRLPGVMKRLGSGRQISLAMQARLTLSDVSTEGKGQLNPEHARWLMRIPAEWESCAPTETVSMLERRRTSSARTWHEEMIEVLYGDLV